ncbi:MAG: Mur ligase domain-containing protein, partial [bacterium]|nr:Mur ligase domain-containing protein [bacterium]
MITTTTVKKYHFLGIAGTAMAGVALLLKSRGDIVSGSDDAIYPPMSTVLAENNIAVQSPYRPENLPIDPATIVVVGNAISRGNPELEAMLERRMKYCSVPELLRWEILLPRKPIVIAGTHGKTSTTSLVAHLLDSVGANPGFLIGGVPKNFTSGARLTDSEYFVIEGDEYDTAYFDKRSKFLHYVPHVVAMLNLEFDHADIFSSIEEIELAFRRLALTIPANGLLVYNA